MRKPGSNGAVTYEAIRAASLDLIFKHGFEAASLRKLAKMVGVQVGSLYNYFDNKDDLLVFIIQSTFEQRQARMEAALEGIDKPTDALCAFVRTGVKLNTEFKQESVIGDRELMRLPKKNLDHVIIMREKYDRTLSDIIEWGMKEGVFRIGDARMATFAILGMVTRISVWYKKNGRLSQSELQELYVDYALRLVGAVNAPSKEEPVAKSPARKPIGKLAKVTAQEHPAQ